VFIVWSTEKETLLAFKCKQTVNILIRLYGRTQKNSPSVTPEIDCSCERYTVFYAGWFICDPWRAGRGANGRRPRASKGRGNPM